MKEIQSAIQKKSLKKKKEWWEAYMLHTIPFRGAYMSDVRSVVKDWLVKTKPTPMKAFATSLSLLKQKYADDKLAGILIMELFVFGKISSKTLLKEIKPLFEKGYITDWNICDCLCLKVLRLSIREDKRNGKILLSWIRSPNTWTARASVVPFVGLTGNKEYARSVLVNCKNLIKRDARFAKTSVGWLLREISKTNPKSVKEFITTHKKHFSNEALRNAQKYF